MRCSGIPVEQFFLKISFLNFFGGGEGLSPLLLMIFLPYTKNRFLRVVQKLLSYDNIWRFLLPFFEHLLCWIYFTKMMNIER